MTELWTFPDSVRAAFHHALPRCEFRTGTGQQLTITRCKRDGNILFRRIESNHDFIAVFGALENKWALILLCVEHLELGICGECGFSATQLDQLARDVQK